MFAMLLFLSLQVASGLFSDDEISAYGPFGKFVSSDIVSGATYYHTHIGKFAILALIITHLLAIAFYFFVKKNNLITPMMTGDQGGDGVELVSSQDDRGTRTVALVVFLFCSALVGSIVKLAG